MTNNNSSKFVGQSVLRREDQYLLRGQGQYIDDVPEPQGTLHLAFVMSPHAHARIVSIDTTEALRIQGIYAILTGEDLALLAQPMQAGIELPGYHAADREVIARQIVRFVGEHVAVILAENKYAAHDAVELVQVEYEQLPAAASLEQAVVPGTPLVHDHVPDNFYYQEEFSTPEFAEKHASGEFTLTERFRHGMLAGAPMEPRGCLAIHDHADAIVFYTSTQIPHLVRTGLAKHLGRSESSIRVIVPDVGGGFGTKALFYPEEIVVAALCFKYRRPIKWTQDRREELLTNIHARDHIYNVEVGFTAGGVITSLKLELFANAGAYATYPFGSAIEAIGGARMIVGPYKIPNYSYKTHAVATHTAPAGTYRGVAQPACCMVIEGLMDRIGRKLGIDPIEIRLRNVITSSDLPWVNALGLRYDTGSYKECLEHARATSNYDAYRKAQPADRLVDGKYRGIGIGNMIEGTGGGSRAYKARGMMKIPGIDSATIRVEPSGKITVYVSHASAGQGHLTTFAQIAADHLGAALDDVTVFEGDTASSPYGTNTFASRSAITGGGAIIRATQKISDKMRRIAGSILHADSENIVLRDGRATLIDQPEKHVTFESIAHTAYAMGNAVLEKDEGLGLSATEFYEPPTLTIANGTHIVSVSVDAHDGRVAIENYWVVHDCGRVINPMIVDGQMHGGVAQGIGEVLMEEIVYDENGQLLNASLLDYLMPTAMDIPNLSLSHLESPSIDALGGFKGVGEGGVIGSVAALSNAIADALSGLGVNVNSVPLRPSRVLSLIRNATRNAPAKQPSATTI
jgi:carbon-monoxide dehydrogenase large subunit